VICEVRVIAFSLVFNIMIRVITNRTRSLCDLLPLDCGGTGSEGGGHETQNILVIHERNREVDNSSEMQRIVVLVTLLHDYLERLKKRITYS